MQLFPGAVPIILRLSPKLEDTYYSQIVPGIICQSLDSAPMVHTVWRRIWNHHTAGL